MAMVWRALTMPAALICALSATSAQAALFSFSASGTIERSSIAAIPVGTPWTLDLIYDTDAPDLDFGLTDSPDPSFGRFTNTGTPPALVFFHYQAGCYAAAVHDPAGFAAFSEIHITFTSVHAIDINIRAPGSFPPLAGGNVFFHADFNDFSSRPIFTSDGLPTNPNLGPGSFDQSTVSLFTSPGISRAGGNPVTSPKVTPPPEPSSAALTIPGALVVFGLATQRTRWLADFVPASRSHSRA